MNPFESLQPTLAALSDGPEILPATGQAQEYLQQFDVDEHYDRIRTEGEKTVREVLEVRQNRIYVDVPPLPRTSKHVFQYFVDGSVKTFFLGTLVEHDRNTPVLLGQIGAAAIKRDDRGNVQIRSKDFRRETIVLLNRKQISSAVWHKAESAVKDVSTSPPIRLVDTRESDAYSRSRLLGRSIEQRSRAAHKANWEMRVLETELLRNLLARHDKSGAYIAIDGSLGKEFSGKEFNRGFVGIVKNFSKDHVFHLRSHRRRVRLSLFQLLASLKVNGRTLAFARGDSSVAFWYLRIREQQYLDYPLMGVMKVEYPNPSRQPLDSELVDYLSRALVAERTVTPHGRDQRWHAHLYPIYLAEQAIKNGFYSDDVLQAGIKWPELKNRNRTRQQR